MSHGTARRASRKILAAFDLTRSLKRCKVLHITGEDCSPGYYIIGPKAAEYIRMIAGGTHYPMGGNLAVSWSPPEGDDEKSYLSVCNELYNARTNKINGIPESWGGAKEKFAEQVKELEALVKLGEAEIVKNIDRFEELVCAPDDFCDKCNKVLEEDFSEIELTDSEIRELELFNNPDKTLEILGFSPEAIVRIKALKKV